MSDAASAVRWLLDQTEPEARRVAVQQIAKVHGSEGPELLLRALGDEDWRVRKEGTVVAPTLDRREEVVAALVAALEETYNIGLRNAAVEALIAVGPDAVGATIETLPRLDSDARKLAIEVLGGIPDTRATTALARALADEDPNVRGTAAESLGGAARAGEESREVAIQALIAALATTDVFLKIAALESLARLEAGLPWAVFEPFAADPLLRRYAIAAAAGSREPEAVAALARATGDPSPTIAREALVALGDTAFECEIGHPLLECARDALLDTASARENARRAAAGGDDTRARAGALLALGLLRSVDDVASIVDALGDDDVAERAELALRLFGPAAVTPLLSVARDSKAPVRAAALSLVASLEGAGVAEVRQALRDALKADSVDVVASGVESLGQLGDAADLRRVASLVWHTDERVAATATNAVAELGARHVTAARALLHESRPGQDPVVLACILLGAIASTQPLLDDDIRVLERALAHDDPQVRRAAIDALAQAESDAAAEAVTFALSDEEHEVKLAAVRALGRLGRPEPLVDLLADARDADLAATTLRALADASPKIALEAARPLVTQPDAAIACAAVAAIGQLQLDAVALVPPGHGSSVSPAASLLPSPLSSAREDVLFSALGHPDLAVVKLALSVLGQKPGPRALARLGLCLDHAEWEVRRAAAELLGQAKTPTEQGLLRARFERERDPTVREAIAAAVSVRPSADGARSSAFAESMRAAPLGAIAGNAGSASSPSKAGGGGGKVGE
ncbi:MAG TPA: HEAT repeat domain-containing protein [Polyangiaceae bacterium]|jgi:HEAT repeat protein|nr:HEAT repeat domain-containing protein [Polyangiaceae bacterium]